MRAEIRRRQAERRKRLKVTVDRIEQELAKVGFSNLFDYVQRDGSIDLGKIDRDHAAAILEVRVSKYEMAGQDEAEEEPEAQPGAAVPHEPGEVKESLEPQPHGGALRRAVREQVPAIVTTKLKLHPKVPALELLGRRHKMFSEKVEHSGKISVVVDL